ncbi:BamA/TamA family outer membrane protein [Nitrospirota bacterium]
MNNIKSIISFLVLSSVLFVPYLAYSEDAGGRLLESVEVRGLRSMEEDEVMYLLDLAPGKRYTDDSVTEGIKRAFRVGIFNGLIVDEHNGRLVITVSEKDILERINIKTDLPLKRQLVKALGLRKGDYVTDDLLRDSIDALGEYIRGKGYPECRAEYIINRLEPENLIEMNIEIEAGSPNLIHEIVVFGRPAAEVKKRLRLIPGDAFDSVVLEEDIEALREYYTERGFISPEIGPVEFSDGKIVLRINAGRRLKYEIETIKNGVLFPVLTDQEIIDMMPFHDEGEVNDDLLAEGVERVIEEYRSRGHSDVQVAPVLKTDNGNIVLRLYVREGSIKEVRSFNVTKNGEMASEGVDRIVNNRRGRTYKPFRLDDDAELIREFYVAGGYRDAVVSEPKPTIDINFVDINVDVRTGDRYIVGDVRITGNKTLPVEDVKKHIKIKTGDPFNEVDLISSRREVQSACRSRGLYYCAVRVSREFDNNSVIVGFELNEGEEFFFGKTIVSGNRHIHIDTIRRHLKFKEGDPLNQEKLIQTRQRLFGLGVFSRVNVELVMTGNNSPDVHISVDESSPGKVDFGIGYGEYEGLRTFIEIGYRNLFSDADLGSIRLEASTLWRRYMLNYTQPYLFGTEFRSRTLLLREEREQKNIDTGNISYRIFRNAARTGLERSMGKHVTASLFYEYSIVDTFDVKPGIVLSKEDEGTLAISSLSPAIYYSTLDDPFDPARGVLAGFTIKDAAGYLLSEAEFTKMTLKASSYSRIGSRVVGALSLGGGMAETRGSTETIPLIERFYLGGRSSVRGFTQDSLGPVGPDGDPTGGDYFLLGNLEFRIDLAGSWRTVLFVDCGNVWMDSADFSTSNLRYSAGTGIRYRTPVGPIRLDYGWKIDRLEGESIGELHFSIGHVF